MLSGRRAVDTAGRLAPPRYLKAQVCGGGRVRPSPAGGPVYLRDRQLPITHHQQLLSLSGKVIFSQELGEPWCWLPALCGPGKE